MTTSSRKQLQARQHLYFNHRVLCLVFSGLQDTADLRTLQMFSDLKLIPSHGFFLLIFDRFRLYKPPLLCVRSALLAGRHCCWTPASQAL